MYPRFVDWEKSLFVLFIHCVHMNNLPISSFCCWCRGLGVRVVVLLWRLILGGRLRVAFCFFFYIWHCSTIFSAASICQSDFSLSLVSVTPQTVNTVYNIMSYKKIKFRYAVLTCLFTCNSFNSLHSLLHEAT